MSGWLLVGGWMSRWLRVGGWMNGWINLEITLCFINVCMSECVCYSNITTRRIVLTKGVYTSSPMYGLFVGGLFPLSSARVFLSHLSELLLLTHHGLNKRQELPHPSLSL